MATSVSLGVSGSVPPRVRFCPCLCRALCVSLSPLPFLVSDCRSALVTLGLRRNLGAPGLPARPFTPSLIAGGSPQPLSVPSSLGMCSAPKELCPGGPDPGPTQEPAVGAGGQVVPLAVSDGRPGEPAPGTGLHPSLCTGAGGLSHPPAQLCLPLTLHWGPDSAPDHFTRYFLKEIKSLGHDSKDPGGPEEEGDPTSHRGRCGVCAYPHLLPKAHLSPGCFFFYDCKHSALFC